MKPTLTNHPDAGSHPSFAHTDHRPWPLPRGRWSWRQSWRELLFAHWPVPAEVIRPHVPPGLAVQEFDGTSWIAVVPFRMAGVMRRPLPDLPWVSAFPELNVRVYVEAGGKPGVFFFSLDATNPLVVAVGRALFHVPYFWANMSMRREGEWIIYESVRRITNYELRITNAEFRGRYRPISEVYAAAPGTLEHFLTERYCLYAVAPDGSLSRTEVHHAPWPLQRAQAEIEANTMTAAGGVAVGGPPALLHFSKRIDVVVWGSEAVGS